MPQPREGQQVQSPQLRPGVDLTKVLPAAVTQNALGNYLPNPDVLSMHQTSKKLKGFFQPRVDALKPLKCIVEGNVDALIALIQDNPGLLFKKGEIKAPRGQTYYNVSPYMLMKFLCDGDMLAHIMPLIPERFNQVTQAQDLELGRGGADLVKLDFDPMLVKDDEFNKICAFKTHFNIRSRQTAITFPLLENPDGLLYWKDAQGEVNFYYANRETQTVIPIIPVATSPEELKALDAFKDSFDEMENNSARRSTNKEHQLIALLMQRTLHQQGIHYSNAQEEHYCDSHTSFQLINCYRKVIRLHEEGAPNFWKRAQHYWRKGVGMAQGEEMWLLQRICEANRLFHPLPQNFDTFKREFIFYNYITHQYECAFNEGKLDKRLGLSFALYKVNEETRMTEGMNLFVVRCALIAVCQLIEDAKTKTIESEQVVDQPTFGPQR